MADDNSRLDLVQRLADRQTASGAKSLAERAAEKLEAAAAAQPVVAKPVAPAPAPPAPTIPRKVAQAAPAAPESDSQQPDEETTSKNGAAAQETPKNANRSILNFSKLERAGYITPDAQQTHLAEEFRAIKRPLLLNAFGSGRRNIERGNVILVTSAQPGEGKTFTAINLAMSMASERDLHVLVIDTDVYRHRLEEELDIGGSKGLVDLLSDDSLELTDLFIRTDIPNLTILPVGNRHPQAPELLASQKMAALMDDIAARYPDRVIIIDSPPVLASSEASVLALLVGQIVMVVEANRTRKTNVERSLKLVSNCENINFVINKTGTDSVFSPYRAYTYYDEYRKQV